jgi:4-amino-4-deoxy-L-arabinose transferase-like glycosyltransferase
MNRPGLVQTVDSRALVSTGVGVILVLAGVILQFAVTSSVGHVMNAHVAAVIVMLAGVVALLLSLLVWGPLNRRRSRSGGQI